MPGVALCGWTLKQFIDRTRDSARRAGKLDAGAYGAPAAGLQDVDPDYAKLENHTTLRLAPGDAV
jgi:hypothetical protein